MQFATNKTTCLPAEEFPQVQVLNPLDGFDRMIHRPFVQSGDFFKLVRVSSELDELQKQQAHTGKTGRASVFYSVKARFSLEHRDLV